MNDDLVKRLKIMARDIEMWEKLSWGSDSALMREAANRIEELEAKLAGAVAECERIGRLWHDAEAKLAKVIAAYRIEAMRRDDYSHAAFDQHLAAIKETPHD